MSVNDILSLVGGVIDLLNLRPFIYAFFVIIIVGFLLLVIVRVARGQ